MSRFIKGFSFVVVLGGALFLSWNAIYEKEPIELTPEKLIETMQAEKIETHSVVPKEGTPIFNTVDSLARLEFYKMHAVATDKILMVYFYTNGCYYCEKMKNITFADSRVQKELEKNYISVSVNYSQYKHIFRKEFHLRATPAIVFFNREGKSIYETPVYGYQGAEDFYDKIEMLAEPF
jgi:thiol:disulfide interchange protein